jgi:hypothetical protein
MRLPSEMDPKLKRRAGVAAQGVPPRGTALGKHGSHGRFLPHPLRCLVLTARVEAMKKRSKAANQSAKAPHRKASKQKRRSISPPSTAPGCPAT